MVPERLAKSIINWSLSSINVLPITVSIITIQWIIGKIPFFYNTNIQHHGTDTNIHNEPQIMIQMRSQRLYGSK